MKASYDEQTRLPRSRNTGELNFSLTFALGRLKSKEMFALMWERVQGFTGWLNKTNKQTNKGRLNTAKGITLPERQPFLCHIKEGGLGNRQF